MMMEQPLAHDEIIDHAEAAGATQTPICLDECIRARIMPSRRSRWTPAHHQYQVGTRGRIRGSEAGARCRAAAGIPVWCGGMLESGIGRAHNIALATLPNFVLPGDVSASKRYWKRDIVQPAVEMTPQGTIAVRDAPGFGYEIDHDFMDSVTVTRGSHFD